MKTNTLTRIYALILLIVFGGIVLHAPFIVGMETLLPEYALIFKSWKEILMVAAGAIAALLVQRKHLWRELASTRILRVTIVYVALHILAAAAVLTGPLATIAGLMIDLRYIVFFVLVYILIRTAPRYRKLFLRVGVVAAVIVVGFGVVQLFLPPDILKYIGYGDQTIQPYLTVDRNPDYVRINSTLRGPNPLGAYVAIILSLLVAAVLKGRLAIRRPKEIYIATAAVLSSLTVLWVTYSRSAVLAAGCAVFLVVAIAARKYISRRVWIAGCIVLFAIAGGVFMGRDHPFITNVILHENREGGSRVSSNDAHVESLIDGTDRMLRQPFGAGVGSTGSASLLTEKPLIIENQYLFIAHEVGWFGLTSFIVLLYFVLQALWQKRDDWLSLGVFAIGIGISLIGLLQPVWVDDTVAIIWWGLAALAIGGRHVGKTNKQKTA